MVGKVQRRGACVWRSRVVLVLYSLYCTTERIVSFKRFKHPCENYAKMFSPLDYRRSIACD
jgi:hypothetical protein